VVLITINNLFQFQITDV